MERESALSAYAELHVLMPAATLAVLKHRSYRGVWKQDKMHGCGIKLSCDDSGNNVMQAGLFVDDDFVGPSSVCDVPAAKQAAQQAVGAANLACGFKVMSNEMLLPQAKQTRFPSSLTLYSTCSHNPRQTSWTSVRHGRMKGVCQLATQMLLKNAVFPVCIRHSQPKLSQTIRDVDYNT